MMRQPPDIMARAYNISNLPHPNSNVTFPAVPSFNATTIVEDRRKVVYNNKSVVLCNQSIYHLSSFFSINTELFAIGQKYCTAVPPRHDGRFLTVTSNGDEERDVVHVILVSLASKPLIYYVAPDQQVYYVLDERA